MNLVEYMLYAWFFITLSISSNLSGQFEVCVLILRRRVLTTASLHAVGLLEWTSNRHLCVFFGIYTEMVLTLHFLSLSVHLRKGSVFSLILHSRLYRQLDRVEISIEFKHFILSIATNISSAYWFHNFGLITALGCFALDLHYQICYHNSYWQAHHGAKDLRTFHGM